MSVFCDAGLACPAKGKPARPAAIDEAGMPHAVPPGRRRNSRQDAIGIGGRDFTRTRKSRNARHNPQNAPAADDMLPPWRPRSVMTRGAAGAPADATGADGQPAGPITGLHPTEVISRGMELAQE